MKQYFDVCMGGSVISITHLNASIFEACVATTIHLDTAGSPFLGIYFLCT